MLTVRTSENTVITSFRLISERQDFSSVRTGENTVRARARIHTFRWLQDYSQALFKHITAKGITQLWKETGCKQNKFSIRLPEKAGTDGANNPYLPENLTKDFDMKPWLDSIFNPSK